MELGNKIKQLRLKASLTQEQLADGVGVSAQSVSKWENGVSMPDITLLPSIAEIFGVSIDDLFDLTVEQKFARIERRMESEDELSYDIFRDYEEFLKPLVSDEKRKYRATSLLAQLYSHRADSFSQKAAKYAKQAILLDPGKKDCQWILQKALVFSAWDWNVDNRSKLVDFYKEVIAGDEGSRTPLPYYYLIDNLIEDNRVDEAEKYAAEAAKLPGVKPFLIKMYEAYFALARHDKKKADEIIAALAAKYPDDNGVAFEIAQYYAKQAEYDEAVKFYRLSFDLDRSTPRFIDAPQAIAQIYAVQGDFEKAAAAYDEIIKCLKDEWKMTEEVALKEAEKIRDDFLAKRVKRND